MRKMGYLPGVAIDDTAMEQPGLFVHQHHHLLCTIPQSIES
jgi:hypothetical protein